MRLETHTPLVEERRVGARRGRRPRPASPRTRTPRGRSARSTSSGRRPTSSKPGPDVLLRAARCVPSPPQATSLSKNCGRSSVPLDVRVAAAPVDGARTTASAGGSGATAAIVRRIAVAVNRSFDGSFSRCTPLISAPRMIDSAATPGALPARMCTRRGGNARTRRAPAVAASTISRQPSSTSGPPSSSRTMDLHRVAVQVRARASRNRVPARRGRAGWCASSARRPARACRPDRASCARRWRRARP